MSDNEYIVWKNTWRHRVLEKLEEGALDWGSLRKTAKLSPHALNSALGGLQRSKIIHKKENGVTVYEICGKYIVKSQDETEPISEEMVEEEIIESLLSKVQSPSVDFNPIIESLSEDDLSTKFSILVNSAKKSIIVVSPFLDENTYTRKLLKVAKEKTLLLVTRPVDLIHWDKTKHQKMLDEFAKNTSIIEDAKVHAKLLVVDKKKCLISSMNLTTNSIMKSKEYGIYLESPEVVNSILGFINDLGEN